MRDGSLVLYPSYVAWVMPLCWRLRLTMFGRRGSNVYRSPGIVRCAPESVSAGYLQLFTGCYTEAIGADAWGMDFSPCYHYVQRDGELRWDGGKGIDAWRGRGGAGGGRWGGTGSY